MCFIGKVLTEEGKLLVQELHKGSEVDVFAIYDSGNSYVGNHSLPKSLALPLLPTMPTV